MAQAAGEAYDAGASIVHVHIRDQREGMGRLPSWNPDDAAAVVDAIRTRVPRIIINLSTGVVGDDITGPAACLRRVRPEYAACDAGTLTYHKLKGDGTWAWPPMIFDNGVEKIQRFLDVMRATGTRPEFECFDTGIVRSVRMYEGAGMTHNPSVNLVMGVDSGMPADPAWLPLLIKELKPGTHWQVTAIGRGEIWPLHRRTAELGGHLRSGVEDTFYLADGSKVASNAPLVAALADIARQVGRAIATPEEARALLHLQ
jgi:uncharacterized protein (DUF849 family)